MMKELFYGILSFWLILITLAIFIVDNVRCDKEKLYKYNNMVIVDKGIDFFVSNMLTVYDVKESHHFICYDIIYNAYEVGDTIRVNIK